MQKVVPVILCGGSGSRLWPLSRMDIPKQFLKLLDNYTLLQKTALRAINVTGAHESDLVVVTLDAMRAETVRQLKEVSPFLGRHVLGEPQARNTAAAVAYAASYVRTHFGENAIMWVLPSDHYIGDEETLGLALDRAIRTAEEGHLVTFGIKPTRPETGYGYIKMAEQLPKEEAFRVAEFVEKPPLQAALGFLESRQYLWSSGMHVFRVRTVLENFMQHAPLTLDTVLKSIVESGNDQLPHVSFYALAHEAPFETAVLEKAEKIAVIPCDPDWSDIGCWESLWEIKPKNENGNATQGRVVCEKTENSMILAQGRLVTCVGLKDIIVIETADSVLVADKRSNGSLKNLVKALQQNGHKEIMSAAALKPVETVAAAAS